MQKWQETYPGENGDGDDESQDRGFFGAPEIEEHKQEMLRSAKNVDRFAKARCCAVGKAKHPQDFPRLHLHLSQDGSRVSF